MEVYANDFEYILYRTWQIMSIQLTIYGLTFSYAQVFIFSLMCCFGMRALYVLWFE